MGIGRLLVAVFVVHFSFTSTLPAADKPPVPDFTNGGTREKTHDWTLGPTGARGWVWGWRQQTTDARQILITAVAPGSPAEGVLRNDDVILGVDGKPFDDDARVLLARAINRAEAEGGILRLTRWRDGASTGVQLKLPVLGGYSPTAPYDCPKSARILKEGCDAIAKAGFKNRRGRIEISIPNDLKAMALLASGRKEHFPHVEEYARAVAAHTPGGHKSWGYAYETLFLAEYAAATKDASVMPGLTRLATDIADGASSVGTWGHSFARPTDKILDGYGNMNQPGLVLTLAMVVAREAGVRSPQIDKTIAHSARFLRYYAGKGAIPYGDHQPWPNHEDNGKCSSAAVLFDLLGERGPATFFTRMSLAAHAERESGHTGNFFNLLWALPGVARGGPAATGAYVRETAWYYDLARGHDGRFMYQGLPAEHDNYEKWDATGAYMLAYALPLKSLVITGKKAGVVAPLRAVEVERVIADGRWHWWDGLKLYYEPRPTEELVRNLSSWSPIVRERSAKVVATRDDAPIQRIVRLLDAPEKETRYGAAVALRYLGTKADSAAADKLRTLVSSNDPWLRALAAEALVEMSPPARKASIPDLLRAITRPADPDDPRRCTMGAFTEVLFRPSPGKRGPDSILRKSFDDVAEPQRPLLMAALREVLKSEDGRVRGAAAAVYRHLSPQQLAQLMPDIVEAIRKPAPSGEMFAYDVRMAGLDLLGRLRIREGMDLAVDILNERRWGRDFPRAANALRLYGGSARDVLPRLKSETRAALKGDAKQAEALEKLIADIEADASARPLRTIAEFVRDPQPAR